MKVVLPASLPIDPIPHPGVQFVTVAHDQPVPQQHTDAEVLVVWGQPTAVLSDAASRLTHLRLVQGLAAGPDQVVAAGFGPQVTLASGVGLHDVAVSEHALALALAAVRSLPTLVRAQIGHRWAGELGWSPASTAIGSGAFNSLYGRRVLVWGFGSIAQHLAPMLTALGAQVTGAARTPGTRGGYPVVDDAGLDDQLRRCDMLIMILPHSPSTTRALDARRLALLPAHAWLVNVGRGSTVDTAALIDALVAGRLAGAALDVFDPEPLPRTCALWDMPNVIITPHAAGGRPLGVAELIDHQLGALQGHGPLRNVIAGPAPA